MPSISDIMLRKLKLHRGLPGWYAHKTIGQIVGSYISHDILYLPKYFFLLYCSAPPLSEKEVEVCVSQNQSGSYIRLVKRDLFEKLPILRYCFISSLNYIFSSICGLVCLGISRSWYHKKWANSIQSFCLHNNTFSQRYFILTDFIDHQGSDWLRPYKCLGQVLFCTLYIVFIVQIVI